MGKKHVIKINGLIALISSMMILVPVYNSFAAKHENSVRRYASTKSNEINMRAGPSVRYPILWVFIKKGEPVEIVAEFEHWRKIVDKTGEEGWVHETMLSGRRNAVINSSKNQVVYKKADFKSSPVFIIEPEARVNLISCKQDWCQIQAEQYKGWIQRNALWGIYQNEEIK